MPAAPALVRLAAVALAFAFTGAVVLGIIAA